MSDVEVAENTEAETPQTWRDSLPEDIREDATLAKYENVDSLAAAHINLQRHLGADKIAKPVTDSDWNDVYNFLGRPEDANGYEIALPEDVQGLISEESLNGLQSKAHELGLNQSQFTGLMDWWSNDQGRQMAAHKEGLETAITDAESAMKEEWGRAYEQNLAASQKAVQEYGGDELVQYLNESGLGNNPALIKAFANIAKANMPDKDLAGPQNNAEAALTPQEARDQASTLMAHPAYMDKTHPEHGGLVKKVQSLFEQAYNA